MQKSINPYILYDYNEVSNDFYRWSTIYCTINIEEQQLPVWRSRQILSLVQCITASQTGHTVIIVVIYVKTFKTDITVFIGNIIMFFTS